VYLIAASSLDIPLDELEVESKASVDTRAIEPGSPYPPSGMENISYDVFVSSTASEGIIQELHDHVEKVCPILNTLTKACPVTTRLHFTNTAKAHTIS